MQQAMQHVFLVARYYLYIIKLLSFVEIFKYIANKQTDATSDSDTAYCKLYK